MLTTDDIDVTYASSPRSASTSTLKVSRTGYPAPPMFWLCDPTGTSSADELLSGARAERATQTLSGEPSAHFTVQGMPQWLGEQIHRLAHPRSDVEQVPDGDDVELEGGTQTLNNVMDDDALRHGEDRKQPTWNDLQHYYSRLGAHGAEAEAYWGDERSSRLRARDAVRRPGTWGLRRGPASSVGRRAADQSEPDPDVGGGRSESVRLLVVE